MKPEIIDWLMEGDAAIRWQTMRDLLDRPEAEWQEERVNIPTTGWGKQLLENQDADGKWGGGIYGPKWTSTTYTLLTLIDFGIDPNNACRKGATQILEKGIAPHMNHGRPNTRHCDLCVWGFYLHVCAYFLPESPELGTIAQVILGEQMDDGGWNCRRNRVRNTRHSSFHTTFNVLEGLRVAADRGLLPGDKFKEAEGRAIEFMLQHRLFKSDKTGEIINPHFTEISYPPRWHYDILRGLDYIRATPFIADPRLQDALDLLNSKQKGGIWPAENPHGGQKFFSLESPMSKSRWNTLRAMRVLNDR